MITLAKDRMKDRALKRQQRHNRQHTNRIVLNENDKVLLKSLHLSSAADKVTKKFFDIYEGPYTIDRVIGPNTYSLLDDKGMNKGTYNIVNLKKYREPKK